VGEGDGVGDGDAVGEGDGEGVGEEAATITVPVIMQQLP